MSNIVIKNLRNEYPDKPYQVRVDRKSLLGNPFYMRKESDRDLVCDRYKDYFYNKINNSEQFLSKIYELLLIYEQYSKLELFCWCAPKRCHAETIKEFLESLPKGWTPLDNLPSRS